MYIAQLTSEVVVHHIDGVSSTSLSLTDYCLPSIDQL